MPTHRSCAALVAGAAERAGAAVVRRLLDRPGPVTDVVALGAAPGDLGLAGGPGAPATGVRLHAYPVDLADRAATVAAVAEVVDRHGPVDLVANVTGEQEPQPLQQIDFASFERTIGANVYAPFTVVQELLRHGCRPRVVVNVASTAGLTGKAGRLAWSAAQAAVVSMSEVMKEELAILGTRVGCLSPGPSAGPDEVAAVVEMLTSDVGRWVDSRPLVVKA